MGQFFSTTNYFEEKIIVTHKDLRKTYKSIASAKRTRSNFLFVGYLLVGLTLVVELLMAISSALSYRLAASVVTGELLALNLLDYVFMIIENWLNRRSKALRDELIGLLHSYEEESSVASAREYLASIGDLSIPPLQYSLSAEDFGVTRNIKQNRMMITKLIQMIVGDGPDYLYALICPNCYHHNGFIDKDSRDTIKYTCKYCNHYVSATEVITKPAAPVIKDIKEEVNVEELSDDSYDD